MEGGVIKIHFGHISSLFEDCLFKNNIAKEGAAIQFSGCDDVIIRNNQFIGN